MEKRSTLTSFYSVFFLSFFLLGMIFPTFSQVSSPSTATSFPVSYGTWSEGVTNIFLFLGENVDKTVVAPNIASDLSRIAVFLDMEGEELTGMLLDRNVSFGYYFFFEIYP